MVAYIDAKIATLVRSRQKPLAQKAVPNLDESQLLAGSHDAREVKEVRQLTVSNLTDAHLVVEVHEQLDEQLNEARVAAPQLLV